MTSTSKQPRGGMTRGKVVAIGVLSVVLLVVIVVQFSGGPSQSTSANLSPRRKASWRKSPTAKQTTDETATATESALQWPSFTIPQVIAHNPFALPEALRTGDGADWGLGDNGVNESTLAGSEIFETRRRRMELIANLRRQGVDMILMTPQGRVARVGDLSLRVGDVVEGLKVQEINSTGIVFVEQE